MNIGKRLVALTLTVILLTTGSALVLAEDSSVDLSIMSFNIRCLNGGDGEERSWNQRSSAVCNYLNNSGADILCLQEVVEDQAVDIMMNLTEQYDSMYYPRETKASPEGLMTIYDFTKFEMVHTEVFWLSETPDKTSLGWGADYYRICVLLVLKHIETGLVYNVYNLHLDHEDAAAQVGGINVVLERMKRRPQGFNLVMGDFNVPSTNSAYSAIAAKMKDCQATATLSDFGCTFNGWSDAINGNSIDFIFVDNSNRITPTSFTICRDKWQKGGESYLYSDHYAVRTNVTFTYSNQDIPVKYGDVNKNDNVGADDALEVLKHVVGKVQLQDAAFTAADTDGNGKADSADALNILKKVVGKINQFPIETAN